MTDWAATLDTFERRLDAQWSALNSGVIEPIGPFAPPPALDPLPAHLVERSTDLVQRFRALEDALIAALAKVGAELEQAAESSAKPPAQPMYFDSRI